MQNDKNYSEILTSIKTLADRDRIIADIDNLMTGIYKIDKTGYNASLDKFVNVDMGSVLKSVNQDNLPEFLTELKKKILELPITKISLAFAPTKEFLGKIDLPGVLEVHVDPSILGGIVIDIGGTYHDLSIRSQLSKMYDQNI